MRTKLFFIVSMSLAVLLYSCEKDDPTLVGTTIEINDNISEVETWKEGNTYVINGTIRVSSNLIIEPGTIIKFMEGAKLDFAYWDNEYVTITAKGTEKKPILFTSASAAPKAGDYNGISLYTGAKNCVFEYCIFEYGGKQESLGTVYIENTSVEFTSCIFRNLKNDAIILSNDGAFTKFEQNSFNNIEKNAISIEANYAHTIGANNNFTAGSGYGILVTQNLDNSGVYTWLAHNTPYIIQSNIRIGAQGNGVKLTLNPGVTIKLTRDSKFELAYWDNDFAQLIAIGTTENPILFTSNSTSPVAGDYIGLFFYSGARNCEFNYVTVEYAGGGSDIDGAINIEETGVKFTNCVFKEMKNSTIKLKENGEFTEFSNNTFINTPKNPIEIRANYVHTIGGNNTFNAAANTGILISNDEEFNKQGTYTWLNHDAPYIVEGNLRIGATGSGVKLTIAAGTTLTFMTGAKLEIPYWEDSYAVITAQGTAENPIVFTSNSPSPAKGDWWGIDFRKGCIGSSFDYCEILYAGSSDYWGAVNLVDEAGSNPVSLSNTRIAHSGSHGITVDAESSLNYSSVTFEDIDGNNYVKL